MEERLLHVFRNTPQGRESLLQSTYYCSTLGIGLHIYIPESTQFLMYFAHDAVQVDLDKTYLTNPSTAVLHARQIAEVYGIAPIFFTPKNFTASELPDIPTNFGYMCCPRSIGDLSSKIGLGYIGPKVRRIVKSSTFPVLLPSAVFKPWTSVTVFYGGSVNANKALRWGLHLSQVSGFPLDIFSYGEKRPETYFEERVKEAGMWEETQQHVRSWIKANEGHFEENLYSVSHNALLVVGAYGHGLIKDFLFGSKMELIQSWMPNNMMLIGPNCIFSGQ